MPQRILLGDEAVALGAVHAGITAAYAYPGTPSTEILEYLQMHREKHGGPIASWCANEKTAYEAALGTCFAGRRALVAMKHVGLNVAADAFINSALVNTHGGLVLAVADDFELYLNGALVLKDTHAPGTQLKAQLLKVTQALVPGTNVLAARVLALDSSRPGVVLRAPPVRVGTEDTHLPASIILSRIVLPNSARINAAIAKCMAGADLPKPARV